MLVGKNDFSGGITTIRRIASGAKAILARQSGYDGTGGSMTPELLGAQVGTAALSGVTPANTPIPFLKADGSQLVLSRDASEHVASFDISTPAWSTPSTQTPPLVTDAVPVRYGTQAIFASDGPDAKLMAYEPESLGATIMRPLSLKSPDDYRRKARPVVTLSTSPAVQGFDITGTLFTRKDDSYTYSETTSTGTFVFTDTALAGEQAFTAGIPAVLTKEWLLLDIYLADDPQGYEAFGTFANDPTLQPSGYEIGLYSDTACTTLVTKVSIPRIEPLGQVHRIAFRLPQAAVGVSIEGVAVETASFYEAPETGKTATLKLYSYAMNDRWSNAGNWFLPELQASSKSPWYDILTTTESTEGITRIVPRGTSILANGGFESALSGSWTTTGAATRRSDAQRTDNYCMRLDNANEAVTSAITAGITAGRSYTFDVWYYSPDEGGAHAASWRSEIRWYTAADALISTVCSPGPTAATPYYEDMSKDYRLKQVTAVAPATAAKFAVHIEAELDSDSDNFHQAFRIDDLAFYPTDSMGGGSAFVLQRFAEGGTGKTPADPAFRWCYCFAGKDRLANDDWQLMISNPSDPDHEDGSPNDWVFADPWRTFTVTPSLLGGPVTAVTLHAASAGTGYTAGDMLTLSDDTTQDTGGDDCKIEVLTVTAGAITTFRLAESGTGYVTESAAGSGVTGGTGTGAKFDVTAMPVATEYGAYLTHVLYYRQKYEGTSKAWSDWWYAGASVISSPAYIDSGADDELAMLNGREVPLILEIANDYASSAKHVMIADGRVYAGCLDYDGESEVWKRRTAIEVSSYRKPWAYPTVTNEDSPATDGGELDGYAVTGSEIRGLVARGDEKFVFLDTEFFLLRGDNSQSGWRFVRLDSIGCVSSRSIADCRKALIWHDGQHFYGYAGGLAQPISRYKVDSSLIDWTKPHSAAYWKDRYVCLCEYDDAMALLIYELETGAWRIRHASLLTTLVGICSTGSGGKLYGVSSDGKMYDLFSHATSEMGDTTPAREVWTQFVQVGSPGADINVREFVIDVESTSAVTLTMVFNTHGLKTVTPVTKTLTTATDKTTYKVGLNLMCNAVQVKLSVDTAAPPTIHHIGFEIADTPAKGD